MRKALALAALWIIVVLGSVIGLGTSAHAAPTPAGRCTVAVYVLEDGSWAGGQVRSASGRLLAQQWTVTGPELRGVHAGVYGMSSRPSVRGVRCTLVDAMGFGGKAARCVATVNVLEDGSWIGESLRVNGAQVAAWWDVARPELRGQIVGGRAFTDYAPTWHGASCSLRVV